MSVFASTPCLVLTKFQIDESLLMYQVFPSLYYENINLNYIIVFYYTKQKFTKNNLDIFDSNNNG